MTIEGTIAGWTQLSLLLHSPQLHRVAHLKNFMNTSSLQNSQPMQFQAPMQAPMKTGYPYSPPPPPIQGIHMPYNFSQQAQAQMNVKPDWATEMIDTVKAMSKELSKLSTTEKTLSGIKISVQNLESKVEGHGRSVKILWKSMWLSW